MVGGGAGREESSSAPATSATYSLCMSLPAYSATAKIEKYIVF